MVGTRIVLINRPNTPSYELYPISFILFPVVVCIVIYVLIVLIAVLLGGAKRGWEWLHED